MLQSIVTRNFDNYSSIKYSHILSLVLYSDCSDLQCQFSKTFRLQNKLETLQSVKQRNREFYHWSRNLREVVEYYGNSGWRDHFNDDRLNMNCSNKRGPFFSGMNKVMVIPEIMIRLNGSCSTSKSIEVATRFAGNDGIIIQMNNQSPSHLQHIIIKHISNHYITLML